MTHDYAIIGAGVFGLALARELAQAGHSVILFDAGAIGGDASNASAGLLGALMPASPLVTGPLAQVQLRCLSRYADRIAQLGAETALPTGYRRSGRVQPILTEQALASFTQQQAVCANAWSDFPANDHWRAIDRTGLTRLYPELSEQIVDAPYGYAVDGVTAQIVPRALLAALAQSIAGRVTLQADTRVLRLDGDQIVTAGATYQARQIAVTAGWQVNALLPTAPIANLITGVKGQACAVTPVLRDAPLLYTRNGYVVFHDDMTALGSTTEKHWADTVPDADTCAEVKDRLATLLPALSDSIITECWAGVRPKGSGALPLIERSDAHTLVASGGYKVGLALAFEIAGWLAAALEQNVANNFWRFVAAREKFAFREHA